MNLVGKFILLFFQGVVFAVNVFDQPFGMPPVDRRGASITLIEVGGA